jgi:hypothetical protein
VLRVELRMSFNVKQFFKMLQHFFQFKLKYADASCVCNKQVVLRTMLAARKRRSIYVGHLLRG